MSMCVGQSPPATTTSDATLDGEIYGKAHAKTRRGGEALATKNEKKQQHEKKLVVVLVVVAAAAGWWTIWWRFAGKGDSKTP